MQKLKVEKREINLMHFYSIFYLLASLSLSNPEWFDWLCHNFPIPGASLSALFSEIWGSLCSLFFFSLQATQWRKCWFIWLDIYFGRASVCAQGPLILVTHLLQEYVCVKTAKDESTHSKNHSAWPKRFAKILKEN